MYVKIDDTFKENILNKLEEYVIHNIDTLYVRYEIVTPEPCSAYSFMFKNERCLFTKDGAFIGEDMIFIPTKDTTIFDMIKNISQKEFQVRAKAAEQAANTKLKAIFA